MKGLLEEALNCVHHSLRFLESSDHHNKETLIFCHRSIIQSLEITIEKFDIPPDDDVDNESYCVEEIMYDNDIA